MHPALNIDEILRHIFLYSTNDRLSLISASQTCKSWKDPALDFIWSHLSSVEPLLSLVTNFDKVNGEFILNAEEAVDRLTTFNYYAKRVKHLNYQRNIRVHPSIPTTLYHLHSTHSTPLPRLTSVNMSLSRCDPLLLFINLSPSLRYLGLDLGFKTKTPSLDMSLCNYLAQISSTCKNLQHLRIRGLASNQLNHNVATLRYLNIISLQLGGSLLPETLRALMTFPKLSELEIHAGHIQPYDFNNLTPYAGHTFPSLSKLHIRAHSSLIIFILHQIHPDLLHHVHLDLENATPCPPDWDTIFTTICDKASNTLRHLALEHHFEIEEPPISPPGSSSLSGTHNDTNSHMLFKTMTSLQHLKHLHYFLCDSTLPPLLCDDDMKKLISWWPKLEHFELGPFPQTDNTNTIFRSPITIKSLSFFAAGAPNLKNLILPLTLSSMPTDLANTNSNATQNLTVAQLDSANPAGVATYLHHLFPRLQSVDAPCDDGQAWIDLRKSLLALHSR